MYAGTASGNENVPSGAKSFGGLTSSLQRRTLADPCAGAVNAGSRRFCSGTPNSMFTARVHVAKSDKGFRVGRLRDDPR